MERKLASVQTVRAIEVIAGADAIELARINGWQCVVKKGEFRAGERGVYLEIDSVPPDDARFSWLWQPKPKPGVDVDVSAPAARPASFRIRTLKLRGALSQGLLLPLASVPGVDTNADDGDDVTALLGVSKYEPPVPAGSGDVRGAFPGVVPKTDEMRVQSVPAVLEELRGRPFVATVKVDGTSATFVVVDGELHVCSRNLSIKDGANMYWEVARRARVDEVLAKHPRLAIQGEIAGPGIQKNPLGLKEKSLFVFHVFDVEHARSLSDAELRAFCTENALTSVPLAFSGDAFDETVESLLAKADGVYDGTKNAREGIVIRPQTPMQSTALAGNMSFKAISNKYLLAERD